MAWPAAGLLAGLAAGRPPDAPAMLAGRDPHPGRPSCSAATTRPVALGFTPACAGSAVAVWRLHRTTAAAGRTARPGRRLPRDRRDHRSVRVAAARRSGSPPWAGDRQPVAGPWPPSGTHAASLLILLPFFLEAPQFPPLAPARAARPVRAHPRHDRAGLPVRRRPALVFAVMPMFAWLAFRGTLREASLLLAGVSIVANTLTACHRPGLGPPGRYDLPPRAGRRVPPALPARLRAAAAPALGDGRPSSARRPAAPPRAPDARAADLLGDRHRGNRRRRATAGSSSSTRARRRCSACSAEDAGGPATRRLLPRRASSPGTPRGSGAGRSSSTSRRVRRARGRAAGCGSFRPPRRRVRARCG